MPLALALTIAASACAQPFRVCRLSERRVMVYDPRVELGIGMHGMPDEHIQRVKGLGIRLVRRTMYWNQVEHTEEPGVYSDAKLAEWDDLVRRCDEQGLILEVVVHANAPGCSYDNRAESYRRFAHFMGDMAARYPSIRYWELWNEMDGAFTDLFGANAGIPLVERGKLYAEMLKLTAPAIREANPQALILTGGMTDVSEFPRGIYEGGGREHFDIMNIHTYGVPVFWSFVARGLTVRQVMNEFGDTEKPLWNTEFGIDAGNIVYAWGFPHDRGEEDAATVDRVQKEQWQRCLEYALSMDLYQKVLPYQYSAPNERNDDGKIEERFQRPEGMSIHDFGFGIVRRDGLTPRPTYTWLKELQFNARLRDDEPRTVEVWLPDAAGLRPVGYEWDRRDRALVIKDVPLTAAYPTLIGLTEE